MPASEPASATARLDDPSARLLAGLQATGARHRDAVAELHSLLLRAARFELGRRAAMLAACGAAELDELAQESADEAVTAVLAKLDSFRGESRFTTWAYKFALLEAAVRARRRMWRGREVPTEPADMGLVADRLGSPHDDAERRELLGAIADAIRDELSERQRTVLVAITLQDVPIDVLAERMGSSRGAIYKTLHDARAKLRRALAAGGLAPGEEPR